MNCRSSILFVDDNSEYCEAMVRLFEESGYRASAAGDGCEALDMLSREPFDLVFSELRLPKLGGAEFMQEIKRKKMHVPVVFVTDYGEVESYMDLMNMGAFEYLNKPLDVREILKTAQKVLANAEGTASNM